MSDEKDKPQPKPNRAAIGRAKIKSPTLGQIPAPAEKDDK